MPPILVIARLTVQESSRRRLLLALLVLTLIVVGFSAWGFNKITTVTNSQGQTLPPDQVALVSSQLLIVIVFMFSGVLALSAAVVAGRLLSGEAESGLLLPMLGRPARRSAVVVGDIGTGLQNQALQNVGVVSHLLLPSDGLWRGAIFAMEPDTLIASMRALGTFGRANPFAAVDPPPTEFLMWVVIWFAGM